MTDFTETTREERDAAIRAVLPHVPALGWTRGAIAAGLTDAGLLPEDAAFLFPRGPVSAIEAWLDLTDRDTGKALSLQTQSGPFFGEPAAWTTPRTVRVGARITFD